MIGIFGGVDGLSRSMSFHVLRQNAIAANIANVDTPGYAPRELLRPDSTDPSGFELGMRVTDARHLSISGEPGDPEYRVVEEREQIPGNDNNFVSLDHEMARLSANTVRFEAVGRLMSKHLAVLGYAAADAGR